MLTIMLLIRSSDRQLDHEQKACIKLGRDSLHAFTQVLRHQIKDLPVDVIEVMMASSC